VARWTTRGFRRTRERLETHRVSPALIENPVLAALLEPLDPRVAGAPPQGSNDSQKKLSSRRDRCTPALQRAAPPVSSKTSFNLPEPVHRHHPVCRQRVADPTLPGSRPSALADTTVRLPGCKHRCRPSQ
jgi:hypothetical protein